MPIVFNSIDTTISTSSDDSWEDIPGLSISVIEHSLKRSTKALIILNIPTPYASGNDYPAVTFAITMNSKVLASSTISYDYSRPDSFGRRPATVQTCIDLTDTNSLGSIQAKWKASRKSIGHIDSYCSISAIIDEPLPGH
ncbi:fucose-binding lectin II [Photorhabdus temperata]|uniref:fucose-binding lectin II n=1 Tax=Photorhabdus temperata TaxID=574560 RepID=UPI000389F3AD|nr:fucose-binding lectin II [Photorhabdus temperata]EQB97956.1 fucose-binding lectin II [Photorhabdus temperata subsp. temperata M1021]